MAKLEFKPLSNWTEFNFLGKRLFDFTNEKTNILTGIYFGDGTLGKIITVDIIPRFIVILSESDATSPLLWIDIFGSKTFDGVTKLNSVIALTAKKNGFILGTDPEVNAVNIKYYYIVFGN